MTENLLYRSYLLRIWRSATGPSSRWAAALEDVRTGERRGFASLAEALAYLDAQLPELVAPAEGADQTPPRP